MDKIFIGLLKSEHNVKIKKAFIEKLIKQDVLNNQLVSYSPQDLIQEIEVIWKIQSTNLDLENQQANYESFQKHFSIIKLVLNHFLMRETNILLQINNSRIIEKKFQNLLIHLINLIKIFFATDEMGLNIETMLLKRERFLILIVWLRLLTESFLNCIKTFELCSNFINILSTINLSLMDTDNLNASYFVHFLQNDSYFCDEFLKLIAAFLILTEDSLTAESEAVDDPLKSPTLYQSLNDYVLKSLFEINSILIRKVINHHNALDNHVFKANSDKMGFKVKLNNLCKIVKALNVSTSKSYKIYELTVRDFINLLCNDFKNEKEAANLDTKLTEVFRCFEINKAVPILIRFFEEKKLVLTPDDDHSLTHLLINLTNFLSWPFSNKIDEWICSIMTLMAVKLQKFKILINICELKCDNILNMIVNKPSRESGLNLLSFFLINYQHSPALLHKNLSRICDILANLKSIQKQKTDEDERAYQHLGLLTFVCISKFGGYPQLYKPALDIILDDICLTGFDSFREKYQLEKISSNLKLISNKARAHLFSFKTIYNDELAAPNLSTTKDYDTPIIIKLGSGLTGLINLGNTCYLNSIIQSLFSCKMFVKSIVELEVCGSSIYELSSLNQLQIIFSSMLLTNRPAIKPTNLVKNCTPSWFRFGQQQDSSEFLNFLLDNLNEQINDSESNYKQPNLIKTSFGIQLTTKCECSKCSSVTRRKENCFYLPLSFNNNQELKADVKSLSTQIEKSSVQKLLNDFFAVENLTSEEGNSYFCAHCNSLQNATKQIFFTCDDDKDISPPNYLILTLNRFVYELVNGTVGNNIKVMDQLDYPLMIEIKTYKDNQVFIEKYVLLSIVVHSGSSLHYGHYYTYLKNFNDQEFQWYLANDSSITKVSFLQLIKTQNSFKDDTPYIIFYERIQDKPLTLNNSMLEVRKNLIEIIEQDNKIFEVEEKNRALNKHMSDQFIGPLNKNNFSSKDNDDDDEGAGGYNNKSSNGQNEGPREVF